MTDRFDGWLGRFSEAIRPEGMVARSHRGAVTVAWPPDGPVLVFDTEGRFETAAFDGTVWMRGHTGGVEVRFPPRFGVHGRGDPVRPDPAAADRFFDAVYRKIHASIDALPSGATPDAGVRGTFQRVRLQESTFLRVEADRFRTLCGDPGILPPDAYRALVVPVVEGCPYGACRFCDFFGEPFRAIPLDEVERRFRGLLDYFGRALPGRRGIFLGGASLSGIRRGRLADLLERIRTALGDRPEPPADAGIGGFLDPFRPGTILEGDPAVWRARGLVRLYLGIETGSDSLRRDLGKGGEIDRAVETAAALREAGIGRGIILMVGLGSGSAGKAHVAESLEAVGRMGLGSGDRIFLSPYLPPDRPDAPTAAPPEETDAQMRALESGLLSLVAEAGVPIPVVPYRIDRFLY